MSSNAHITLKGILERERNETSPNLSASDFFELFSAEQILKNYGLAYDEIEGGLVDLKGDDGGIDAIFTFVNGVLAQEDADYTNIRQSALITLIILQSKTTSGFSEDPILRLESTTKDLLDISHELSDYSDSYNANLIRAVSIFHRAYRELAVTSPVLEVKFYYVTMGDQVHPNVLRKSEQLKKVISRLFSDSVPEFSFVGAEELLARRRKSAKKTIELNLSEALSTPSMGTVCLVPLKEYYEFIRDPDNNELKGWLFEENIRDYEGRNIDVNKGIRGTLESPVEGQDFWWLNNGITIVAASAPLAGKTLSISDPKIVNGLQTSIEVYNFFSNNPDTPDTRNILVRAVVTNDEKTRNDIIRATNSQSTIRPASLRAFDPIHYAIEEFLGLNDFYYDRRKNFYKNQGRQKDKIISIQYLAQAVAAILLQRPNDSRGRPINLITNQSLYERIFSEDYPIRLYLECTKFMREIEKFLNSGLIPDHIRGHEVNVRFQLAMFASAVKIKRLRPTTYYINKYGIGDADEEFLTKCLNHVWEVLQSLRGPDKDIDEDKMAKSADFDEALKKQIRLIVQQKTLSL
ncbi:MAG: AIPR family protein [Chloroflexi bacterium]|nr:AIPR family protein [Chloroflexota bacterium]